jgi:hypothetical protein
MSAKPELPDWSALTAEAAGNGSYVGVGHGVSPPAGSYWWHMRRIFREEFARWREIAKGRTFCGKPMRRGETCARTPDHRGNCKTAKAMDNERARHGRNRANGAEKRPSGRPGPISFDGYMGARDALAVEMDGEGWRGGKRDLGQGPDC